MNRPKTDLLCSESMFFYADCAGKIYGIDQNVVNYMLNKTETKLLLVTLLNYLIK